MNIELNPNIKELTNVIKTKNISIVHRLHHIMLNAHSLPPRNNFFLHFFFQVVLSTRDLSGTYTI